MSGGSTSVAPREVIIDLARQRCNIALTKKEIFVNIWGKPFTNLSTIHLALQQSRRG
jgi:hypothetical protein